MVSSLTAYEVRCDRCKVSFPPETKRCLHCGGRTHAPAASSWERDERAVQSRVIARAPGVGGEQEAIELKPLGADEAAEMEVQGRTPARIATAAIWLMVALAGSLYRLCAGEGG